MKKIPRKIKKQIPDGMYCYTPIKYDNNTYHVKPCKFLGSIKIKDIPDKHMPKYMDTEYMNQFGEDAIGWCKLVKYEVDDQCKSCGIKLNLKKK